MLECEGISSVAVQGPGSLPAVPQVVFQNDANNKNLGTQLTEVKFDKSVNASSYVLIWDRNSEELAVVSLFLFWSWSVKTSGVGGLLSSPSP